MLQYSIPWESYSEEEIQEIIAHIFSLKGYQIYNIHKADRSREQGADLECVKIAETNKILIAVKKKPSKKDIYQLNELKKRFNNTKIYVYVQPPSSDFFKEMTVSKDIISFWDSEKLTYELFSLDIRLYMFMIIENYILKESFDFNYDYISFYNDIKEEDKKELYITKLDYDMIKLLWNIKDRSVSVHKSLRLLQDLYDQTIPLEISEKHKIQIINGYLSSLFRLKNYSILPLIKLLKNYMEKYPNNFTKYCIETEHRSNWLHLYNHFPKLLSGYLIKHFRKDRSKSSDYEAVTNYIQEDIAYLLGDVSRILSDWPFWMEDAVDDFLSISVSSEFGDFSTNFPDPDDFDIN